MNVERQPAVSPIHTPEAPAVQDGPTEQQLFWRQIFQTGELTPYDREKKPIKWDAFRDASYEFITDPAAFIDNLDEHIKKIDYEFRGEREVGDGKTKAQRTAALLAMMTAFWAFDYLTGPVWQTEFDSRFRPVAKDNYDEDIRVYRAVTGAVKKFVSVLNDKYASDLSNLIVKKLTGTREGFNHQIADKGADTLNTGFVDFLEDKMNAPMIESGLRILFQVPIAGALLEQGAVRLTNLQEKSPLHTNFGKMVYMSTGVFIDAVRAAGDKEKNIDMVHALLWRAPKDRRSVKSWITKIESAKKSE